MNIEDQTLNEQNSELEEDLYYKNAFTKTENQVNLEVDNARINCLTSKNNKFSLDEEGNLTVNSITTNNTTIGGGDNQNICDLIYPIGSIYLSMSNTDPSTLFGGTWESINGYYLYAGVGGNTSGSNTSGVPSTDITGSTALTVAQMPSHTHIQNAHSHTENPKCWINDQSHYDTRLKCTSGFYAGAEITTYYTGSTTATNKNTGGGQGHTHTLSSHTHEINPLRFEVYTWKRTA